VPLNLFLAFTQSSVPSVPGSLSAATCIMGRIRPLLSVGVYVRQKSVSLAVTVSVQPDAASFNR